MDAAERALLADTVGAALGGAGANADAQLAELGWLEMLATEPRDAIAVVFEGLGTTNRAATLLDDVVISALGLQPRADLAVLFPPFGAWTAPGVLADGEVQGAGIATARAATARELLVVCDTEPDGRAVVVPAAAVDVRPVRGVDPEAGLQIVTVARTTAVGEPLDVAAWESGVALGRRAIAQQMLGSCRTMLALARDHAAERVQFGRSISSFQAVRHRLAEALVAIEALAATLDAAGDEPNALTAALAKATAGRTAQIVATHCQQVLAGIGFTTDHPFHQFLKRTMLLEGVLGSADRIASDLGRQLLAARRVPTLIEL